MSSPAPSSAAPRALPPPRSAGAAEIAAGRRGAGAMTGLGRQRKGHGRARSLSGRALLRHGAADLGDDEADERDAGTRGGMLGHAAPVIRDDEARPAPLVDG